MVYWGTCTASFGKYFSITSARRHPDWDNAWCQCYRQKVQRRFLLWLNKFLLVFVYMRNSKMSSRIPFFQCFNICDIEHGRQRRLFVTKITLLILVSWIFCPLIKPCIHVHWGCYRLKCAIVLNAALFEQLYALHAS